MTWVQTRSPHYFRKLSQREDGRLVAYGVAGGYLRTFEFQHGLAWARRLICRYTREAEPTEGLEPTNAQFQGPISPIRRQTRQRIEHQRGALCAGLRQCPGHQTVAVEATGNWYWIIGEIEEAGHRPLLVHPSKAKLMMGQINKTDKLDVHGLNRLQRNGTLPTVWIPLAELRDQRELTRTRLVLVAARTRLKNRLNATLAKYGLSIAASDSFGKKGRHQWNALLPLLPPQTRFVAEQLLRHVDFLDGQIEQQEKRLEALLKATPMMQRLQTLPGIGLILSATIALELGDIHRFASHEHLASYAGTTPRVHSSGDKTRYGQLHSDVNRYIKWAYAEAANGVALNQRHWPQRHVAKLYRRLQRRKGHAKAVGAVARDTWPKPAFGSCTGTKIIANRCRGKKTVVPPAAAR